jgi:hypothetical protein
MGIRVRDAQNVRDAQQRPSDKNQEHGDLRPERSVSARLGLIMAVLKSIVNDSRAILGVPIGPKTEPKSCLKLPLELKRKTGLPSASLTLLTSRQPLYEIKFTLVCPGFGLGI